MHLLEKSFISIICAPSTILMEKLSLKYYFINEIQHSEHQLIIHLSISNFINALSYKDTTDTSIFKYNLNVNTSHVLLNMKN
jgi:hypothetical protein